ncbi:sialate O-acetylesterase [uncultured Pontibacter sp.]|uniref:sialate O-acetylesterase n=1 Tax=uncultured Pontibacter sp. TaxID=453356 RepID=UPI0026218ED7|nr:sialate O-acetylesterase [uncultured Pontibacter sp.]
MHFFLIAFLLLTSCSDTKLKPDGLKTKKIFLVAGQSNAQGHGDYQESPNLEQYPVYEFDANISDIKKLKDPVGANGCYFEPAQSGSAWPSFAEQYHQLTGDTLIIVQAAKGGSSCHPLAETNGWGNWDPSSNLFACSVNKTKLAEDKLNTKLAGIIWSQGENDADAINKGIISASQYKQSLTKLINNYRAMFGSNLKFYIIQTGYHTASAPEGFTAVQQIQQEVADEDTNTFVVYDKTKDFIKLGWMKDVVHYNQNGLNDIGRITAAEIVKIESSAN